MTSRRPSLALALASLCLALAPEAWGADRDVPAPPKRAVSAAKGPETAPPPSAPPAAWLAIPMLHRQATEELKVLIATLDPPARDKLVGAYVAFDATMNDLGAMAGCDDDGDYVVVVSDALLSVIDGTSRAQATDKLDAYASFLVRNARPHTKLAAPPPGFFDVQLVSSAASTPQRRAETQAARARDALSGVLAHELAHMTSGDVTCRHPTAGRESGDDTWTAGEQARSFEAAERTYTPQRVLAADSAGTSMVLSAGRGVDGLVGLLSVLDRVERNAREGYAPTYLKLHPSTAVRLQWVEAAATHWRQARVAAQ